MKLNGAILLLRVLVLAMAAGCCGQAVSAPSWSEPVAVNSDAAGDAGADGAPIVRSAGGGRWVVAWQRGGPTTSTLRCARSVDDGRNWSPPAFVGQGEILYPDLAVGANGRCMLAWVEKLATGTVTRSAVSGDYGATWAEGAFPRAFPDDGKSSIPVELALGSDLQGSWMLVAVRNETSILGNSLVLYSTVSGNDGVSWSEPAKVAKQSPSVSPEKVQYSGSTSYSRPELVSGGSGLWFLYHEWSSSSWSPYGSWSYKGVSCYRTENGGQSWSPFGFPRAPVPQPSVDEIEYSVVSNLCRAGKYTWAIAWHHFRKYQELYPTFSEGYWISYSRDLGSSWSAPVRVPGIDYCGQMAASGGGIVVAGGDPELTSPWSAGEPQLQTWLVGLDGEVSDFLPLAKSGPSENTQGDPPRLASDGTRVWMTVGRSAAPLGDFDLYCRTVEVEPTGAGDWELYE